MCKLTLIVGTCVLENTPSRQFEATRLGTAIMHAGRDDLFSKERGDRYSLAEKTTLHNGDLAFPGTHVIVRDAAHLGSTYVATITEIVQRTGSIAASQSAPDAILLQKCDTSSHSVSYNMPLIQPSTIQCIVIDIKVRSG